MIRCKSLAFALAGLYLAGCGGSSEPRVTTTPEATTTGSTVSEPEETPEPITSQTRRDRRGDVASSAVDLRSATLLQTPTGDLTVKLTTVGAQRGDLLFAFEYWEDRHTGDRIEIRVGGEDLPRVIGTFTELDESDIEVVEDDRSIELRVPFASQARTGPDLAFRWRAIAATRNRSPEIVDAIPSEKKYVRFRYKRP